MKNILLLLPFLLTTGCYQADASSKCEIVYGSALKYYELRLYGASYSDLRDDLEVYTKDLTISKDNANSFYNLSLKGLDIAYQAPVYNDNRKSLDAFLEFKRTKRKECVKIPS